MQPFLNLSSVGDPAPDQGCSLNQLTEMLSSTSPLISAIRGRRTLKVRNKPISMSAQEEVRAEDRA